jgi:hypothetical protein
MQKVSDEVFRLDGEDLTSMPHRSMREGILDKTLEEALQTLLEKYPQIIPGTQIDPVSEDPPNFVLLSREMPVGGWSLDHLFVDQKGVLTLVETKLFQNPESRREVIGQIIEYAANATEFWSGGSARQKAAEFWGNQNPPKELDEVLMEEFGEDLDTEVFWAEVEENLGRGKIRLIIAADELRPEVRRMIEYLNKEMQNAEVLGLELRCYGEEQKSLVLVPRLVGQTQSAIDRRVYGGNRVKWTVDRLENALSDLPDHRLGQRLQKILDWAVEKNSFMTAVAIKPTFGLQGRSKDRIITLSSNGEIYSFMNKECYPGGATERDELVGELKKKGLLDRDLDADQVVSSRMLTKKLYELTDDELEQMLAVFAKYCV